VYTRALYNGDSKRAESGPLEPAVGLDDAFGAVRGLTKNGA